MAVSTENSLREFCSKEGKEANLEVSGVKRGIFVLCVCFDFQWEEKTSIF